MPNLLEACDGLRQCGRPQTHLASAAKKTYYPPVLSEYPMSVIVRFIERVVVASCRHARAVIAAGLIVAIAAGIYTANNFAMNTDSESLISSRLPWRQNMARFDKLFPQRNNLILVVIDGATAERAQGAANALAANLRADAKTFPAVRRPDGGEFFERNGLLYLSEKDVRTTTQKMITAQPFLGALAADPSLRGVMGSLDTILLGINSNQAKLADIDLPMLAFTDTLEKVTHGQSAFLSWNSLFTGDTGGDRRRAFIEVQPKLDFDDLTPGAAASRQIRTAARTLGLTPATGVQVRLTGPVPLSDEEFATIAENGPLMGGVMLLLVVLCLWLAVHSFRIILCILTTLAVGLTLAMAAGLLATGQFNVLSIAFVALFVGLGVDFAIQFSVRYRAERYRIGDLADALKYAGRRVGIPLALAAAATAAGFFSFLPTDYTGVAELGFIAGIGMVIAFALSVSFLPALLFAAKPVGEAEHIGFKTFAPADNFLHENRRLILVIGAVAGMASLAALPFLKFDSNPIDLRSRHVESVSTLYDMMKNPETSPYTIDVLAPSLDAADKLADRLSKKPEIGMALTLKSFVPENQQPKLAMISDASFLLDAAINPFEIKPTPSDAETVKSLIATAAGLRQAAERHQKKTTAADAQAKKHALRLAAALDALAKAPPATRARATTALIPGLETMLDEMRAALTASEVSIATMPKEMRDEWVATDGTARVSVFPKTAATDDKSLKRFSKAVLSLAPNATGAPITIEESGKTIVHAFVQAGIWSFLVITLLLFLVLKRPRDVLMTIIPLLLTALLTLATCVVLGIQLNFANIIALPLLFGIGVAFDIYFLIAWRSGTRDLLQSSLTRAVIFSAMTTASGFGSLWLSSHPGTASMGILLIISLGWTLFTTLFFMPALLGPPPETEAG
jgi:uncharacterized protein